MGSVVFHFSGRGNSLSVAQELAERLPNSRLCPMAVVDGEVVLSGGMVGLVLPVNCFGIPAYVRRFVRRLRSVGSKPYVFAVITCGGVPGASLSVLASLLQRQGLTLSAGWVMKFGLEPQSDDEWNERLGAMADVIRAGSTTPLPAVSVMDRLMTGVLNPLASMITPGQDRKFLVNDKCNGCGICAQVCPVQNIVVTGGRPVWQHHCEQCAACFSWCPQRAISGSCLAARTHYRNPRISLEQLLSRGASGATERRK